MGENALEQKKIIESIIQCIYNDLRILPLITYICTLPEDSLDYDILE